MRRIRLTMATTLMLSLAVAACGSDTKQSDSTSPPVTAAVGSGSTTADSTAPPDTSTSDTATGETAAVVAPIYLGLSSPFSGSAAFYGDLIKNGLNLAVTDAKDQAVAKAINLVIEDDACTPETAVSAVTKLSTDSRVQAIIGPACSGAMAATQLQMADAKMPHLSGGYSPSLTEQGDKFYFRLVPSDKQLQAALADYAAKTYKTVAIVHGTSGYSVGVGEAFQSAAEALGVKVVSVDTYDEGATDFAGQVSRLKDSGADAFFFGGYEAELGLLVRQTRQFGLETPILGPTAMGNKEFLDNAAGSGEGVVFASNFVLSDPGTADFAAAYKAAYQGDATDVVASSYLMMATLIDSLKRAGTDAKGAALRDAIMATDIDTPLGPVSFTDTGDMKSPRILLGTIKDGKATVLQDLTKK